MKHRLNEKIMMLEPSASIELMEKAKAMRAAGIDIINLSGGEPDFDTPAVVCEAAWSAIKAGKTHYTSGRGILSLRKRIAKKLNEENGIACTEANILVTPGAKYAIYMSVVTLVPPGGEVIIPTPSWLSYGPIVSIAGGTPVPLECDFADGYTITRKKLEKCLTAKTRAIIINTPNNPTGRMLTESEAADIADFAAAHELYIIADEIYERVAFDGRKHISLGANAAVADRVVTVNGLSKSVAMTGWRIGYMCADKEIVDAAALFYQHTATCISEFTQEAALTALDCEPDMERMCAAYQRRRDILVNTLSGISRLDFIVPEGTFYLWLKLDKSIADPCGMLLEKASVVAVPGSHYCSGAVDCVRLCFAENDEMIERAAKNIRRAIL